MATVTLTDVFNCLVYVGERGGGSGVYRGGGGHQVQPGVGRTSPRRGTGHNPPRLVEQRTIQVGQGARIQGIFDGIIFFDFVINFLMQKKQMIYANKNPDGYLYFIYANIATY